MGSSAVRLPAARALDEIIETAYHASFLREELRSLRFRLLVASPTALPTCVPANTHLHILEFNPSRLSPTASSVAWPRRPTSSAR